MVGSQARDRDGIVIHSGHVRAGRNLILIIKFAFIVKINGISRGIATSVEWRKISCKP